MLLEMQWTIDYKVSTISYIFRRLLLHHHRKTSFISLSSSRPTLYYFPLSYEYITVIMVKPNWEVDLLIVSTITQDAHSDTVYANGVMQIPVLVTLGAIDKETSDPYELQDSDLASIQLFDFNDPHHATLDGDWFYTEVRNPMFLNTVGIQAAAASASPVEASAARTQLLGSVNSFTKSKMFWVSSNKVEDKLIGALVTQPDKTVFTTKYSAYNKNVKLTGKKPVVYTTDNVTVSREDTGNGTYNFYSQDQQSENWYVSGKTWDHDNYYVTSNAHRFVHADIHGTDVTGLNDEHTADLRLANVYGYYLNGTTLELSFLWPFGGPTTTIGGLFKQDTYDDKAQAVDAFVTLNINNRSNAVCLSRLALTSVGKGFGPNWTSDASFTVYDVFGNSGEFVAGFSADHNLVTVTNALPKSS